jgi:hypothetical protein
MVHDPHSDLRLMFYWDFGVSGFQGSGVSGFCSKILISGFPLEPVTPWALDPLFVYYFFQGIVKWKKKFPAGLREGFHSCS